jgi:hypothetical protein
VKHVIDEGTVTKVRHARKSRLASLTASLFFLPFSVWAQLSPCDLNQDGAVDSADVTVAVNMVLGVFPCTANITGTGGCTAAMVQRVVAASLSGGTCHPTVLSWTASTSSNAAGYNVYRGAVAGGPYVVLNSSPVTTTTFADATCQPGQTYFYVVTAVDINGNESAYSDPPVAAVVPTP